MYETVLLEKSVLGRYSSRWLAAVFGRGCAFDRCWNFGTRLTRFNAPLSREILPSLGAALERAHAGDSLRFQQQRRTGA